MATHAIVAEKGAGAARRAGATVAVRARAASSTPRVLAPLPILTPAGVLALQHAVGNRATAAGAGARAVQRLTTLRELPDPIGAHVDNALNMKQFREHAEQKVCNQGTKSVQECMDEFDLELRFGELKADTWTAPWQRFSALVAPGSQTFTVNAARSAWEALDRAIENVLFALHNKEFRAKPDLKIGLRRLAEHQGLRSAWPHVLTNTATGHWSYGKRTFHNNQQRLPPAPQGGYTEFRVPPPGRDVNSTNANVNPGALRGVYAQLPNGNYILYFTDEHYENGSFCRIMNAPQVQSPFAS